MRRNYMKRMGACIVLSACILVGSTYAGAPGSKEDPLVTKSYVDDQVKDLQEAMGQGNYGVLEEQLAAQSLLIEELRKQLETTAQPAQTYELITIAAGGTLIAEQGTEMILRAGKANIMGSYNGGVQDVTEGVDLQHGQEAPKYHLLISPRTEGRGLFAETEIIVMVRGGYTIQ